MNFPPKKVHARRSPQASPPPSSAAGAAILAKVSALRARHEQVKLAYHQLHLQIEIGLLEAGEVFASLAVPLMKLVGLKTMEMADEGRFASIIVDISRDQMNHTVSASTGMSQHIGRDGDRMNQIHVLQEENYAAKAEKAGKQLQEKQQRQLIQLVQILRQTEIQVNSRQNDILQIIDTHRTVLHKFFQKAVYHINALHSQNHETFPVMLKLLHITFNNVGEVLGSVESGLEDLMQALAEKMCNPMVGYVNHLKAEMKLGACAQFMSILQEMEREVADRRRELEDARKRVRVAEEAKMEAVFKLKEIEERVRRMNGCLKYLPEAQKRPGGPRAAHKCLAMEANQASDDKVLWELLKRKREQQAPESPMGPKQLSIVSSNNNHSSNSTTLKPFLPRRPVTRTHSRLSPQTPCFNTLIPLGSSPSTATPTGLSTKRFKH